MKVLFATDNSYLPQGGGGQEASTHELCESLLRKSISVAVLTSLEPRGLIWLRNRMRAKFFGVGDFPVDQIMGYPTYRGWGPENGVNEVVRKMRPDVAIIQANHPLGFAKRFVAIGVPCIVYFRGLIFEDSDFHISTDDPHIHIVTNSGFTAERFERRFGVRPRFIPPLVDPERYRVKPDRERVVFINPIGIKGLDIALSLAEGRPDIPFDFVESWRISNEDWRALRSRTRRLGNVTMRRRVSDMRSIYRRAKLVLMPSVWNEPWGRVATEAQVSGIPILASDRGGLPESVGPGGILMEPEADPLQWQAALSRLWDDPVEYETFSCKALDYSKRPEIQPEFLIERLMSLIERHKNSASELDR